MSRYQKHEKSQWNPPQFLLWLITLFLFLSGSVFSQDSQSAESAHHSNTQQDQLIIGSSSGSNQEFTAIQSYEDLKNLPPGEYYLMAQAGQNDATDGGTDMAQQRVLVKDSFWSEYYLLGGFILSLFLLTIGYLLLKNLRMRKSVENLSQAIREKTNRIRKLNLEILINEEKQRQHIATEFHDRVAQYLAMAKIKLGSINQVISNTNYSEAINEAYQLVDKSIKDTRLLIRELNPPVLRELDIGGAIVWLVDQVRDNYGIHARINNLLSNEHTRAMDMETQTILFQSTREILNNVIKHAKAESVDVEIWSESDMLWIKVEDDGVGFQHNENPGQTNGEGGYGLNNIRDRLKQINCQFEIEFEPGLGTRVKLAAPLRINEMHKQTE